MPLSNAKVYIVDDDLALCQALIWLFKTVNLNAEAFQDGLDFLQALDSLPSHPACLLLDLRMPGLGGLAIQERLVSRGIRLPILFLTSFGDVKTAVRAMRMGAVDFLEKPFNNQELLDKVQKVLAQYPLSDQKPFSAHQEVLEQLTPREMEVMVQLVLGKSNKVVATEMDISIKTVEYHRANLMRKLNAKSLADLIALVR
ncbi:MAG: response regulator transcription factor [Magnetococcales bacterium]|nr:response regulator transcription factor [Magnetococcales bacterium]NGZ27817.1 response regulator transcription factor [Magnetococcales bacterium]